MIKTIPMWKMMMVTKGKIVGGFLLVSLFVFIAVSVPMFIEGLHNGDTDQTVKALASLLFFGMCALVMLPSNKYVPGKTFRAYRNKKFSTQAYMKYSYGAIVATVSVIVTLAPEQASHTVGMGLLGLIGLYYYSKSLKFHADVDFAASDYLATALGFSAGEKILVSYQNFYADEIKKGSNAFAATATKLIVAQFDGHVWKKLSRDLSQVSHIGIIGNEHHSHFVKLQFNDGADALLSVELYEKLTSNPTLVVRKLLESIDASLLGERAAPQAARRSRVVVESAAPASTSQVVEPETAPASSAPTRNIEFTPDMLTALKNADEVAPGRRLEL